MPQEVHLVDASWPIPLGVTGVTVQLRGGGGSGVNSVPGGSSGGGGGGEYGKQAISVTAGNNLGLFVGGIGGSSSVSGANNEGMFFIEAKGGGGAAGQMGGVGGSGGAVLLSRNGGYGGNGGMTGSGGGGGGAAGGFSDNGGHGDAGGGFSGPGEGGAPGIATRIPFDPAIITDLSLPNVSGRGGYGGVVGRPGEDGYFYGGGGGGGGSDASAGVGRQGVIVLNYGVEEGHIGLDPQGPGIYHKNSGCLSGVTSATWSHETLTGNNRYLLVGVSFAIAGGIAGATATVVTYGGVALTKIVELTNGSVRSELWGLVNPLVGVANVGVTFSATVDGQGNSLSFSGVDQTTPIEATASFVNVTSNYSAMTITTVTDRAVVIDLLTYPTSNSYQGASQVLMADSDCAVNGGMSRKGPISPPGQVTMSWGWGTAGESAHVAVALRPASSGNWWPFFDAL